MRRVSNRPAVANRAEVEPQRDQGAILVLVLVLCLILGVVVVGVANYATAGLRGTRATQARNLRTSSVDGGLRLGVELMKQAPSQCSSSMTIPAINGLTISLSCAANGTANTAWVPYRLIATTSAGGRAIADIQVSTVGSTPCTAACTVTINSWSIST
ncbi:MAG: hypothetical protein JWM34_1384 [Ilumatobacteraceae bacterium]|nr:hypothetical protein [Ilumatobacteraceae bacterium]